MLETFYAKIAEKMAAMHAFVVPDVGEQFVRQHKNPCVIFVPDDDGYTDPEGPGGNPRPLKTVEASTEVYVRGDTLGTAEGLRDQVVIAIHQAAKGANPGSTRGGRYKLSKGKWTRNTFIARSGFEYRFFFVVAFPIVERSWQDVTPPQKPTSDTYGLPDANTYPTARPTTIECDVDELDSPTVTFSITP